MEHNAGKATDAHPMSAPTERVQEHAEDVAHDGLAVEGVHAGAGALDEPEDELRQPQVFVGPRVVEDGQLVQLSAVLDLRRQGEVGPRIGKQNEQKPFSISSSNEPGTVRLRRSENNMR